MFLSALSVAQWTLMKLQTTSSWTSLRVSLQCNKEWRSRHRRLRHASFYLQLDKGWQEIPTLSKKMNWFASTYSCKRMFSFLNFNKKHVTTRPQWQVRACMTTCTIKPLFLKQNWPIYCSGEHNVTLHVSAGKLSFGLFFNWQWNLGIFSFLKFIQNQMTYFHVLFFSGQLKNKKNIDTLSHMALPVLNFWRRW